MYDFSLFSKETQAASTCSVSMAWLKSFKSSVEYRAGRPDVDGLASVRSSTDDATMLHLCGCPFPLTLDAIEGPGITAGYFLPSVRVFVLQGRIVGWRASISKNPFSPLNEDNNDIKLNLYCGIHAVEAWSHQKTRT